MQDKKEECHYMKVENVVAVAHENMLLKDECGREFFFFPSLDKITSRYLKVVESK